MKNNKEQATTSKSLQEVEVMKRIMELESEGIQVGRLSYCNGLPVVAD